MFRYLSLVALAASVLAAAPPTGPSAVAGVGSGPLVAPPGADAAARAAVRSLPRATAVNDADGNKRFDDLDAAIDGVDAATRLDVLLVFRAGISGEEGADVVRRTAPGAVLTRTFHIIPAVAASLTPPELAAVALRDEVRQIELDRAGLVELGTATEVMGADAVVDTLGVTGDLDGLPGVASTTDVAIAVLDTGIDTGHQELAGGKVVGWHDLATGSEEPSDGDGHGTHVANIAAGWGVEADHRGVAPGAALVGLRISGGGVTSSNAIAAYEWIVDHGQDHNIRVATMSFGFGTATDGTSAMELAVDATWDAGVVTIKSNGNGGPATGTMTVPAAARGILSIGSLLDPWGGSSSSYGFVLSEFSSRGPTTDGRVKPDLTAPGDTISAARAGSGASYTVMSGTSMAAPFAAGAAALVLAADPTLTPDEVRQLLFATSEDRGADGPDNDFGHGRIQVYDAVAAAADLGDPTLGSPPLVPRQLTLGGTMGTEVWSAEFEVEASGLFPVAVTVMSDGLVLHAEVRDPSGQPAGAGRLAPVNVADRQHNYSFFPDESGTYTVRVVATPGSAITVDVSTP